MGKGLIGEAYWTFEYLLAPTGLPERALPSRREGWTARSRLVKIKIQNRQVGRTNSEGADSFWLLMGSPLFLVLAQVLAKSVIDR